MISIVVHGPVVGKNEKHSIFVRKGTRRRAAHVGRSKTDAYEDFCWRVALALDKTKPPPIRAGVWHVRIRVYWPRLRHLDRTVPFGDVDACVETVLDALQLAGKTETAPGWLDDDVRVVAATLTKHYDKANPRVEVEFRPHEEEA